MFAKSWMPGMILCLFGGVVLLGCSGDLGFENREPKIDQLRANGQEVDGNGKVWNLNRSKRATRQADSEEDAEPERAPLEVTPGSVVLLTCEADDPDKDPVTFRWSASKGDAPSALAAPAASGGTAATTPAAETPAVTPPTKATRATVTNEVVQWTAPGGEGLYTVTCAVSDDRGGITARVVLVMVTDDGINNPPVARLEPQKFTVAAGATADVTVTAFDLDMEDELEYQFFTEPGKGTITASPDAPTKATYKAPATAGEDTIFCIVTDKRGSYVTAVATVTITAAAAAAAAP